MLVKLADNIKTGQSANWPRTTCRPTRLCHDYCYGGKRDNAECARIKARCGLSIGTNTGPITWKPAQQRFAENLAAVNASAAEGTLAETAALLCRQVNCRVLRGNGLGDLTNEIINELLDREGY